VKLLGLASDMDEAARARFRREVGALAQLAHPHLVSMLDHGVDGELGPYLVLPLLAGTNLRALCGGRTVCPEAALLLIQPIVQATVALHAAGYVHRDLKPENVIAGPDGSITVIDLGLAWRDGMTRHTDTGVAVGSIGYMAPEQIEGHAVDGRADVWAIGIILYEWIAGKRPFARGRPTEEAGAMLVGAYARLTAADRRCSDELADLVARCLAIDPARRPSAAELATTLEAMIDWTDSVATERATVVADPSAYQARVAPFRVRRVERLAREAIESGLPFVALAYCDRGLAYVPDHPQLLELVAGAESATARPAPTTVDSSATRPIGTDAGHVAVAAPSEPTRRARARWPWLVAAGLGIGLGVVASYLLVPDRPPRSPAPTTPTPSAINDRDRELMGGFISLFGQAIDKLDTGSTSPPAPGVTPTTATGWLQLAATQPPAEAVKSLRHALALSPTWLDAQIALCIALAASRDDGAIAACEVALRRRPDSIALLAARGTARLHAGDARAALGDLDRVVAADPDPRWRRLRARARTAAGDLTGAQTDLDHACQLGDATACHAKP